MIINDPLTAPYLRALLLSRDINGHFKKSDYYKCSALPGGANCQVFYDIEYLCKHWGRLLKIVSVVPEAYWFQTAVLMEKTLPRSQSG
jgi:hypothetical protein